MKIPNSNFPQPNNGARMPARGGAASGAAKTNNVASPNGIKSNNSNKSAKGKKPSRKKKKSSGLWVFIAIVLVMVLFITVAVVKKSKRSIGPTKQDAFDSWSSLVSSGSFEALSTANQAGNEGYLYQETAYNNGNTIYAAMKKAVLSTVEYDLPDVRETGLFNKGDVRQGNLNKDNIDILRTTLDWSKVPVNQVDIREAINNWNIDKQKIDAQKAKDKEKKNSDMQEGATASSQQSDSDKDKNYVNDINSVSYNVDSAEIFAEWATLMSTKGIDLKTSETISAKDLLVDTGNGYTVSSEEDKYLDNALFSSDAFINCMNDFQNQLYLMSGGQADDATTKRVFGIKDIADTSNQGADAPQKQATTNGQGQGQPADGQSADDQAQSQSQEGQPADGQTQADGQAADGQASQSADAQAQAGQQDAQQGIQSDSQSSEKSTDSSKKTSKNDFKDMDLQRDGLQIYDYDTDIKGIQLEDGTVLKDSDPSKDGVQLADGTTVEGIPVPDDEKDLKEHKENVLTDLVKDRWVIDKTWVGTYRLLSGDIKVVPQKGDGSFDDPATVGTRLLYTQKGTDKDGKPVDNPLSVTLSEFRVGGDAISWYESKDARNRGFDVRSNSVQVGMVFTLTNLGSTEVTFGDDSTLSDNSGNPTYRTGTVYGLKDSVTLKPGESGKIETWTAATAITEKYIIWGKSYMQDKTKNPLYFRVLKSADTKAVSGQSAQELAGTAGKCSNSEAGCEVTSTSTSADAIPGTQLAGTTTGDSSSSSSSSSSEDDEDSSSSDESSNKQEPDGSVK